MEDPTTEPHSRTLCGRVATEGGISVTHHRIEFYGRCPGCQRRAGGKGRRRRPTP